MTITVTHKALAPALARASGVAPNSATIPIIQCMLLETSDAGLFVTATDMDITYRERVDATPREDWRGCVDAVRLQAFVGAAAGDGDVTLRADEDRLTINCARASCRFPTLPAEDFPLFSRSNKGAVELTFDAAELATGLRAVMPAISTEGGRFYLCGAFLHAGKLCATDGNRLALATVAMDLPEAPDVIAPGPTVTRLVALLRGIKGAISVTVSETQIIVGTTSWALTSKVIDGTFPDYRRVLPERSPSPLLVRNEALRGAAALVARVLHGDKTRGLRLAIAGGELLVASSGSEALGACEVTVPIESGAMGIAEPIGLNPRYLLQALDAIDAELVEIHPSCPVWLCASGAAHDGSLIMPMRV